jgi:protein-S-isoprenylcysteine O-methyltransferase Ste14
MVWAWIPVAVILVFVALGCLWRPWLQSRRYGGSGLFLFTSKSRAQRARDGTALLLPLFLVAQAVAAAISPDGVPALDGPFPPALSRAIGVTLMAAGVVLFVAATLNLGSSWRVGIEETARPGLVTTGLYAYTRNPIFLAMLVTLVGYVLTLPTRLSLVLLLAAYAGIRAQISAEEAYLSDAYGDAYRAYARRVGRLVPGIGRVRRPPERVDVN